MALQLAGAVLQSPDSSGESVTALCERLGISRQTFYTYRRRVAEQGLAGLTPRSRRPLSSPNTTKPEMVEAIVRARKQLEEEGWDNGATSIHARLASTGLAVPTIRTVHRVLVGQGLVVPDPKKRPRSSLRRFEFPATDDCWQIDGMEFVLSDPAGTKVVIFQVIDDHSRFEVADLAWPAEDTIGAWTAFSRAVATGYGPPVMVLSDNGTAFTGKHMGKIVRFEKNLAALGVRLINSRPYHPQTCGKNERAHRTLRHWLSLHTPTSLPALQTLLDTYRPLFNNRPHQALNGKTPTEQRLSGRRRAPHQPTPITLPAPTVASAHTVDARGTIHRNHHTIRVGSAYIGQPVTAYTTGTHMMIFYKDHLIIDLTLDPTRTYQPNGRKHQGKKTPIPT